MYLKILVLHQYQLLKEKEKSNGFSNLTIINRNMFPLPEHRGGDLIDLRAEMHGILFGSNFMVQKGHWIVYRRFDLSSLLNFIMMLQKKEIKDIHINIQMKYLLHTL